VRAKAEEMSREKSRITGELGALKKRLDEMEAKCRKDFDCGVEELPALITQFKAEAKKAISNAEAILESKSGTPIVEEEETGQHDDGL